MHWLITEMFLDQLDNRRQQLIQIENRGDALADLVNRLELNCALAGLAVGARLGDRHGSLVGAKTQSWNVMNANMVGALTDKPAGIAAASLPYKSMIQEHARWCETGGQEGAPSVFDGADLRALETIRGYNLTALSAKGAVFYALDMEGVQLQGAHLEGCDLRNCNLRRADLRGAKLANAKLSGSDLREAQMGPLLLGADRILACDLRNAELKGADLTGADVRNALFLDADVSRANFTGALLRQANFTGVIRHGAKGLDDII